MGIPNVICNYFELIKNINVYLFLNIWIEMFEYCNLELQYLSKLCYWVLFIQKSKSAIKSNNSIYHINHHVRLSYDYNILLLFSFNSKKNRSLIYIFQINNFYVKSIVCKLVLNWYKKYVNIRFYNLKF